MLGHINVRFRLSHAYFDRGRYVLTGGKPGSKEIDAGAGHLNHFERLTREHNDGGKGPRPDMPSAKIVLTGTEYGYRRPDGVCVVPMGCLKP